MYWSDSEGSGGTRTETSAATTPASVLSASRTPTTAGSVKSVQSMSASHARTGLTVSPVPASAVHTATPPAVPVLTPKATDKENVFSASSAANTATNTVQMNAPKSILKKAVTIHTPTSAKQTVAPAPKAQTQAQVQVQASKETDQTAIPRVSLNCEMHMESEGATSTATTATTAAAVEEKEEQQVVEAPQEGADINTGRWVWFGLVVLHMFLQH